MLTEFDQSTMANMTAALEFVCKRIPTNKDSHATRKRIADAMVETAKAGNRGYVDFQNIGLKVLAEIVHPSGSGLSAIMNRIGGRTIILVLVIVALALIWAVVGHR